MKLVKESKEYLFGDDRPFRSCHASTIVNLPDGRLMAAWFGGTEEGNPDVDIWFSVKEHGIWSEPLKAATEAGLPHWNPVLFSDESGVVHLFYKVGHTIPGWFTRVTRTTDGGRSWSDPAELVSGDIGGRGPVRSKPIVLSDGAWLAPASIENERWDAFTDRTVDGGRHWTASGRVPLDRTSFQGKGVIQPTLWESEPGQVHMLLRSTEGWIFRSDSADGGLTWSEGYPTEMPNNNSGIDLVKMDNGALVLVHNPVRGNWAARTPLVVSVSVDNGGSWEPALVLEQDEGEYSYPAVIADGNRCYITYTWKRERMVFCELEWQG